MPGFPNQGEVRLTRTVLGTRFRLRGHLVLALCPRSLEQATHEATNRPVHEAIIQPRRRPSSSYPSRCAPPASSSKFNQKNPQKQSFPLYVFSF